MTQVKLRPMLRRRLLASISGSYVGFVLDRDDFLADDGAIAPKLRKTGQLWVTPGKHHWMLTV
jgi:hypothetical protein